MKTLNRGQIRYWALLISFALHTAALGIFTGVRLHSKAAIEDVVDIPVTVQMVQHIIDRPKPVRPKPRVEPVVKPPKPKTIQPTKKEPLPIITEPVLPKPVEVQVVEPVSTEPIVPPVPATKEVEFFGQRSVTARICYVVDCSGSMYGQMYQVRDELEKSILNLSSDHAFAIVLFRDGQAVLTSGSGYLEPASVSAKSRALELIKSVRPVGSTNAAYALDYAMRMKDSQGHGLQSIYFLTDGFELDEQSSEAFIKTIVKLRAAFAPNVTIHTFGFWPQSQDLRTLKRLAAITGGEFIKIGD